MHARGGEAAVRAQDNSTKCVIDTPPSETWQIAFNPAADSLLIAAAGGSSNRVVIWSGEDASMREQLGLPAVRLQPSASLGVQYVRPAVATLRQ